jgi:cyclopropane-fatty-acyl-phospholipid synthase
MTALRYGVQALGITLSQNQATLANERIARAGLQDRCRVEVRDYRDVNTATGFDKLAAASLAFGHAHSEKDATFFKGRNRPGVVDTGKRPWFPLLLPAPLD